MSDFEYDVLRNFRFEVEIGDLGVMGFNEVNGFEINVDVIEYREGDHPTTPYKLPGLIKYSNITFKHGVTDDMQIYEWIEGWVTAGLVGRGLRKTITIHALDDSGAQIATWELIDAFPCKYSGPDFNATGSEVAIESIELAHEGLRRTA